VVVQDLLEGGRLNGSPRLWPRIALTATLVLACDTPRTTIDDAVFVEAMAQLASANRRFPDTARSDSAAQAILQDLALSRDHLVAFAEAFGEDTERMFRLFEAIRVRTDSLDAMAARGETMMTEPADTGSAR
jgi:hypothetical protein